MTGWSQDVPNHKDGTADPGSDRRPRRSRRSLRVGATFASPDDEHYYGLGQNQEGFLDHRGHAVRCWADYLAPAAPSFCVPFLVTNKGYGLLWDNPSKTTIEPGFNEQTRWTSEVGDRVSFFVIAGNTADEIYAGYRLLTGPDADAAQGGLRLHPVQAALREPGRAAGGGERLSRPPSARRCAGGGLVLLHKDGADGLRSEVLARSRGDEQAAARHGLRNHDQRVAALCAGGSLSMPSCCKKGWFIHYADGKPIDGLPYDRAGSDIDTTNPDAAAVVLEDDPRQHPEQGLRLALGRRDRARPASQWRLLPHRAGDAVLQRLSALPHRGALRRIPQGRAEPARADSLARCVPGRAAQRNHRLVVGYLPDVGHAASGRFRRVSISRPRAFLTGRTTRAAGSICPRSIIRRTRRCSIRRMRAPMWAATTIIRSSTRAGSSTRRSCPSSARTAAGRRTRSGRTASRPSRSWRSICACATS